MAFDTHADISAYIDQSDTIAMMLNSGDSAGVIRKIEADNPEAANGLMRIGLNSVMSRRRHDERNALKQGRHLVTPALRGLSATKKGAEVKEAARLNIRRITDAYSNSVLARWKLDNGQPLGAATVGYIRSLANQAEALAYGHTCNSRFYYAIAGDHPDESIVRDVATVEGAEAAREAAFGSLNPKPLSAAA